MSTTPSVTPTGASSPVDFADDKLKYLLGRISEILQRELADDPERLLRLLGELASLDPEFARALQAQKEAETA